MSHQLGLHGVINMMQPRACRALAELQQVALAAPASLSHCMLLLLTESVISMYLCTKMLNEIVFTKQLQVLPEGVCFVTIMPPKFSQVTCKQCTAHSAMVTMFPLGLHPRSLCCRSVDFGMV